MIPDLLTLELEYLPHRYNDAAHLQRGGGHVLTASDSLNPKP